MKAMASYVGLAFTPRLIVEIEAVLMQDRPEYSSFHCEVFCESTCFLREMIEALVPDSLESSYEEGAYALIDKLHSFDVDKSGGHRCAEMLSGDGEKELPSPEGEADELISQFLFEGDEFLSNIRSALTSLLQNNQQVDLAEDVYRQVHSFKGNCSLMNYPDLERLSVAMELALGLYKSGAYLIEKKLLKCCLAQMADLQAGLGKMKKGHEPTIDKLEKKIKKINSSIPSSHIKKQHLYSFSSIVETEKSVVDVEHHSEESSLLKDFTICVVEDSVLSRKKIKSLLESQKYKVIEACDGMEAMSVLRSDGQQRVDLVITDLGMPRMDGHELVKTINVEFEETPILILSGAEDIEILQKLIGQKLNGYIQKNTPRAELFSMVKRSLGGAKKKKLLSNVIERMKQIGSIIKSKKDIDVDVVKLDSMINIVDELIEAEAEMSTDPEELRSHDAFVEDRAEQLKNLVGDMVATEKASKG